ncbi:hypothetical protein RvY_13551 [Ramazzottius varieornatus]|uniref:Uncharacterized protein n=1 Tax=Ramazzottius varieornatus TaxID=947166 RepID=A0A1D1VWS3_RAMVA|nr:hypothetical protein RvY_13551 [Ramazzottius varieornatus]
MTMCRTFKLFCPLDHIAKHLWKNNPRHPERLGMDDQEIPMFKEYFDHFPRPQPALYLMYTNEQAALVIQKHWKGTLTRRRPEIRALRKHIAAARIQYCDPRKLVEDLWNRKIPALHLGDEHSTNKLTHDEKTHLKPLSLRANSEGKPPALPAFLNEAKQLAEEAFRKAEDTCDHRLPSQSDSETEEKDKAKFDGEKAPLDGSSLSNQEKPEEGTNPGHAAGSTTPGGTRKSLLQGAAAATTALFTPLPELKATKDRQADAIGKKPSKLNKLAK